MQTAFYVSHNNENVGPYPLAEIVKRVEKMELLPTDYIYVDTQSDWVALLEFEPFMSLLKAAKPSGKPAPGPVVPEKVEAAPQVELTSKEDEAWFVLKGDKKFGPFAYLEVVKMLQEKSVFEFDFVWKKDFVSWVRIAELEAFHSNTIRNLHSKQEVNMEVFFRRRHARSDLGGSLVVHDNQSVWKGESMEISEGGCGIKMFNALLSPGNQIFIHFKPNSNLPPFNAVCEIVSKRFVKDIRTSETPIVYGVKFISITNDVKMNIRDFTGVTKAA